MRIFALLGGLAAGLIGLGANYLVDDMMTPFVALWGGGATQQLVGRAVWHAIPAASILGGLLSLLNPGMGGLLLLLSIAGWSAVGATAATGFDLPLQLCLGLASLATIAAFFSGGRRKSEKLRLAPTLEDLEREAALRLEPSFNGGRATSGPYGAAPEARARRPAPAAASPNRSGNGWLAALAGVNSVAVLVLAGAVGLMLYRDFRMGTLSSLVGDQTTTGASATPAGSASTAAPQFQPEAAAAPVVKPLVAPEKDEPIAAAAVAPAKQAASTAAASADADAVSFTDPFSYCASVKTVDAPDRRYGGPPVTREIAVALRVSVSFPADRLKWRCADGVVLACASFDWPICAVTPTVEEMVGFCKRNPDAKGLQAPNGNWSCDGTRPVIPEGESWPVDARGFLPGAWVAVVPKPAPGGSG